MVRDPKPSGRKSTFGQPRDLSNSRKPLGSRSIRKQIVIVVEGVKTECMYFKALARDYHVQTVKISVYDSGGKTAPGQIVDRAVIIRETLRAQKDWEDDIDEIWCVFDTEDGTNINGLSTAYQNARKQDLKLAISNPSFEYWYLIHFEETDREFANCEAVIRNLRNHLPEYEKNKNIYPNIKPNQPNALENANRLRSRNQVVWNRRGNPSSEVDKLVILVKSISEY